jgi:hypothetical protein
MYSFTPSPICRRLLMQVAIFARSFAPAIAGNIRLARIAMIAMTTSSSIKVKPPLRGLEIPRPLLHAILINSVATTKRLRSCAVWVIPQISNPHATRQPQTPPSVFIA